MSWRSHGQHTDDAKHTMKKLSPAILYVCSSTTSSRRLLDCSNKIYKPLFAILRRYIHESRAAPTPALPAASPADCGAATDAQMVVTINGASKPFDLFRPCSYSSGHIHIPPALF